MIGNVSVTDKRAFKLGIPAKTCIAIALAVMAVVLPQIVHAAFGQKGGVMLMPMYLPVLLGGCLLGASWGLGISLGAPTLSFLLTSLWGNPMPAASRLPFMIAELAVFAAVSGLFSVKISKNGFWAFPAVLCAQICGRLAFLLLALIFNSIAPFSPQTVLAQIQTGLIGIILQAVIAPLCVIAVQCVSKRY